MFRFACRDILWAIVVVGLVILSVSERLKCATISGRNVVLARELRSLEMRFSALEGAVLSEGFKIGGGPSGYYLVPDHVRTGGTP